MWNLKNTPLHWHNRSEFAADRQTSWALFFWAFLFVFLWVMPASGKSANGVDTTSDGVSIRVKQVPLRDLLRSIESESGIHFQINESLLNNSVNADIQADTWTEAVLDLLEDINRIELWQDDDTLASVRLLGNKEWSDGTSLSTNSNSSNTMRGSISESNSSEYSSSGKQITLSKDQLQILSKGPYRSPLPENLYHEAAYRNFLGKYGINSQEDLNDRRKAMRVRREARKQLRLISKQESQENK
jgi:hypothetical protein